MYPTHHHIYPGAPYLTRAAIVDRAVVTSSGIDRWTIISPFVLTCTHMRGILSRGLELRISAAEMTISRAQKSVFELIAQSRCFAAACSRTCTSPIKVLIPVFWMDRPALYDSATLFHRFANSILRTRWSALSLVPEKALMSFHAGMTHRI
jgi:hypothetical protein